MCGRLNIEGESLSKAVSKRLNINYQATSNPNLCPSQNVSTLAFQDKIQTLDTVWGIKPEWAKKLIINAQSESVALKPTFKRAFAESRCVVPCSGWYEWCSLSDKDKHQYLFRSEFNRPLYMAGIYYPQLETPHKLVTLTTKPSKQCAQYHHRMPLLLPEEAIIDWLTLPVHHLAALMQGTRESITISQM